METRIEKKTLRKKKDEKLSRVTKWRMYVYKMMLKSLIIRIMSFPPSFPSSFPTERLKY